MQHAGEVQVMPQAVSAGPHTSHLSPLYLASEVVVPHVTDCTALLDCQCHCLNLPSYLLYRHVIITHDAPDRSKELIPAEQDCTRAR